MDPVQLALIILIVGIAVAFYFFFASFVVGAGYQPTPRRVVRQMLEWAALKPDDLLYDLGAGTGALVFAAATDYRARVIAVEVEPIRILILYLRRAVSPARSRITIRRKNLFSVNVGDADAVVVFLWPGAMARLRPQLEQQLQPGARVVSYWHPIPDWEAARFDRDTQVYLYRLPAPRAATPTAAAATPGGT